MSTNEAPEQSGFALILTVMVSLVIAGLVATMVVATNSGLKLSRNQGDSANALQVADAGINAAVKTLTDYTGASPLVLSSTLSGSGDSYTVTATKESPTVWHLDAVGTDANGARRRILADAVAVPLLANAVFAKSNVSFGSGVAVDSFSGGATQPETCNGLGYVGTNNPAINDINVSGGGGGVRNCTSALPAAVQATKGIPSTGYVFDACVGYAANEPVPPFLNESDNTTKHTCGEIKRLTPLLELDSVSVDGLALTNNSLVCTGPLDLAPGKYFYHSITLKNGCRIPNGSATQFNPVKLYTDGPLNIGDGSNQVVNAPASCAGTGAGNDYYGGTDASPLSYYCRGWAGQTQIYAAGSGAVNFENHVRFFGVVFAPERVASGGPHPIVWGAIAVSSVDSGAQVGVHFDEALGQLTTGKFTINVWREAPLT